MCVWRNVSLFSRWTSRKHALTSYICPFNPTDLINTQIKMITLWFFNCNVDSWWTVLNTVNSFSELTILSVQSLIYSSNLLKKGSKETFSSNQMTNTASQVSSVEMGHVIWMKHGSRYSRRAAGLAVTSPDEVGQYFSYKTTHSDREYNSRQDRLQTTSKLFWSTAWPNYKV